LPWRKPCDGRSPAATPGGAAAFYDRVHAHAIHELELDTATVSPLECALRIKEALGGGFQPRAVQELARKF
jgi:chloramphenicol 3-O phosphotransferase